MTKSVEASSTSWFERLRRLPRSAYDWVLGWAEGPYAVPALIVLAFAEASFFPIPPDVLLLAMCLGKPKHSMRFAAFCTVGSVLGGLAGYLIGALIWGQLSPVFFQYVPGFTPTVFENVQSLYLEYGVIIVFVSGFTPIPYKIFTVTSGVMGLAVVPFLLASACGRACRFFLVAGCIYLFGPSVKRFIDSYFNLLVTAFTVLLVAGFAGLKWL